MQIRIYRTSLLDALRDTWQFHGYNTFSINHGRKKMKRVVGNIFATAIGIAWSLTATAYYENYKSNFVSPIPPACITNLPVLDQFNTSGTQLLSQGTVDWTNLVGETQELEISVYQKGCPDSGRRVLLIELELLDNADESANFAFPPQPWARLSGDETRYRLRLNAEPNTNQSVDNIGSLLVEGIKYLFIIDAYSPLAGDFDVDLVMTAPDYNGAFTLDLDDVGGVGATAPISAYQNNLRALAMTLTGRLSGNWVTPGVPDQGFVLAFEELADSLDMLFFLSWYTYDSDGNLLWLTGATTYEMSATQVTVDIELVTNGQFLGTKTADRTVVGTATLKARDCNHLELVYNLSGLGMGSGTIALRRIFSLEIQGYTCGDYATRIEHINDGN